MAVKYRRSDTIAYQEGAADGAAGKPPKYCDEFQHTRPVSMTAINYSHGWISGKHEFARRLLSSIKTT